MGQRTDGIPQCLEEKAWAGPAGALPRNLQPAEERPGNVSINTVPVWNRVNAIGIRPNFASVLKVFMGIARAISFFNPSSFQHFLSGRVVWCGICQLFQMDLLNTLGESLIYTWGKWVQASTHSKSKRGNAHARSHTSSFSPFKLCLNVSTGRLFSTPSLEYVQRGEERRLTIVPCVGAKMTVSVPPVLHLLIFYNFKLKINKTSIL